MNKPNAGKLAEQAVALNDFSGKVALITGTSGIARAAALRIASGGGRVVAMGNEIAINTELEKLAIQGQYNISVMHGDVSNEADMSEAVRLAVKTYGGLDTIVNSAAMHPYGDVVETTPKTWLRCMSVNIGGIYLSAHFGVPEMRKRGGGTIVNLASVQGYACQKRVAAYATTKGAIHALTRSMALDFALDNIRVNSVSPGSVRTPMLELAARTFDGQNADVGAVFKRFGDAHPLKRIGEPEEIAEVIAFLASDRSTFCTGADYVVDGGLKAGIGVV